MTEASLHEIISIATINGHTVERPSISYNGKVGVYCTGCKRWVYGGNEFSFSRNDWKLPCGNGLIEMIQNVGR